MDYTGKVVVITGGTGGIGLATGRHLLELGVQKVALLDIDYYHEYLENLKDDFPKREVIFHKTDVTKADDVQRAFKEVAHKFKHIDIVITCAGILDEHNYEDMLNINLVGVIRTNYAAIPYMSRENGGRGGLIVNIASVTGVDCSQFSTPIYNASKHAVVAFTRTLGNDFYYQKYGIKFITVCPGVTLTTFLDDLEEKFYSPEAFNVTDVQLQHLPDQTVEEFASTLTDVLALEKNGSVWIIDNAKFKEIEFENHWINFNN